MRNVEQTDETDALPEAKTNVSDVEDLKGGVADFLKSLHAAEKKGACLLHHLSEGTDAKTRGHFLALQQSNGKWAMSAALAGIHCVALEAADLDVMADHGAAIVWSPLSNLLLYGKTAKIKQALARGIRVALGSDWSPSGSKNLLGELKAARAASDVLNFGLSDEDLVHMVTDAAAAAVSWSKQLGSIEVGKKADLVAISGNAGDPANVYTKLVKARETDVQLVVVNGIKRYGTKPLMKGVAGPTETVKVKTQARVLNLQNPPGTQFPAVAFGDARQKLAQAMKDLPKLAKAQENAVPPTPAHPMAAAFRAQGGLAAARAAVGFEIHLDELTDDPGSTVSPSLPRGMAAAAVAAKAKPLSQVVKPLKLDPATVVDDAKFLPTLAAEKNLSQAFKSALRNLY
jgi:hypothetical protein